MKITFTYLDAEGVERVYEEQHTFGPPWSRIGQVFQFGYVSALYSDRIDVVPIHRLLGVRVTEEVAA